MMTSPGRQASRTALLVVIAGSIVVLGVAGHSGALAASLLVGGWIAAVSLAALLVGADSRERRGSFWKPVNSLDWLMQPLYAPQRLEGRNMEGADMNSILAAELARERVDTLHREAAAGRLLAAAATARPRWRRAVGTRLVRVGVRVAAGWNAPAGPDVAASLLRPEC